MLRAIAGSSKQASEAIPEVIAPLSPSPSDDASILLPASIPFTEGSLLSDASPLNQQKPSQELVVRQNSQEKRIISKSAEPFDPAESPLRQIPQEKRIVPK